jgi:D-alanyl-D-alanine carboxypeptidase
MKTSDSFNNDCLEQIKKIHAELGIPDNYGEMRGLKPFFLESNLTELPNDIDSRMIRLEVNAAKAWKEMKTAAKAEGIELKIFSGFRDYEYQKKLIERRVLRGLSFEDTLKVLAAPGFSEHHTGRALDITTENSAPGEEEFEQTPAFAWLSKNASKYNFKMSYPRNNKWGFIYEPWHWTYQQ